MYLEGLKIDCISDTHTKHDQIVLPGGDILIHSGDCCLSGSMQEALRFLTWFADQDYSHLILVPGNHDVCFEDNFPLLLEECKSRGITLLNDSGCEIEGIRIWGSASSPEFCNWAFNRRRGEDIKRYWDMIPEDTEILITHGPAHMILDTAPDGYACGCKDLLDKILNSKIKLHLFGHIHGSRGYKYWEGRTYVNASSVNEQYYLFSYPITRIVKAADGEYYVEES
jgi:Icc-related predicted phosphoesterase